MLPLPLAFSRPTHAPFAPGIQKTHTCSLCSWHSEDPHMLPLPLAFNRPVYAPFAPPGYILPTPVPPLPLEQHDPEHVSTCFELPLKPEYQGETPKARELRARFSKLSPTLLLFLRKLHCLSIHDEVTQEKMLILKVRDRCAGSSN